ncbi:MAG TPA: excinuclease ABC subunit UvrA [Candidatus Saccharimonadales bacterium]|nr:excinuclease ABC subunit UvrA [Candidatus Saccharimonadales bacterium]
MTMQEYIEIRGAHENNLKDVTLKIPKRKITIFTGVSGSGKSSIVFDTIAAEAQRLLNENFSMFVRNFLPHISQPQAEEIKNLSMAVIVDQKQLGGGSHSTVGTVTDISTALRLLFSRIGKPYVGYANLFSFNDPGGMCPECNGLGRKLSIDFEAAFDMNESLNSGAILMPDYVVDGWYFRTVASSKLFDNDKKLKDFTEKELDDLYYSKPVKVNLGAGLNLNFEGVVDKFTRKYIMRDLKTMSERTQKAVAPFITMGPCTLCHGARISQKALACKIGKYNIAELSSMQVDKLADVIKEIDDPAAKSIVKLVSERLSNLVEIGLGYLSLDRTTDTLSGGESQRVKMVKHLNGSLVDVMYIFDEPSVGLHPRDVHRLNELLKKLRDRGNTVIVVEHDPDVIKAADHIVDVGPFAGTRGGEVVFEGTYSELLKADTLTGKHINNQLPIKSEFRTPTGKLAITDAHVNNLQHVSVDIPTGVFTVITGVAGSGKSSLINQVFLRQHPNAIVVDQSPVGTSSRSNPATYTGIMDVIRKAFAAANKVDAGLFSFNSKGACENCKGAGVITTDLGFLDDSKIVCDVCEGRRFKDEVLAYKYNGKSISEALLLTVAQAIEFFDLKEIAHKLQAMHDVGLDYLTLGQPLSTLSGGECQRIKLASELHKKGSVYVLDEPTTGLHMSDISRLRDLIDRLVGDNNTIITIEHNLDIIRGADWIIDLGPEGGNKGGQIMFEGTPAELAGSKKALIAEYL